MNIPILYEDHELVVINKPSGIVVNRAESVIGETIQDWAEKKLKSQLSNLKFVDKSFTDRAGIVHRLDKETSGILIIAKTPQAFSVLQRQFKERLVQKTYLALVHGELTPQEGEIHAPVGRLPWDTERFGIVPEGRDAVTRYKVISRQRSADSKEHITLVELHPETGRTHQIRVHLKYVNHPIVGDYLYAGRKTSRNDRASQAPRVMLHAWKIVFTHPASGKTLAIEAPIPDDMSRIIE